MELIKMV